MSRTKSSPLSLPPITGSYSPQNVCSPSAYAIPSNSSPTLVPINEPQKAEKDSDVRAYTTESCKESGEGKEEGNESDVLLVDWDGPNDPLNPKNWTYKQKWAATIVISSFTFISPISSSMVAPASEQIAQQFGMTNTVMIAMITCLFILGYAVGPLFLGPLSEIYGRSRVIQLSNLFYMAWNLGCGFAQKKSQLIAFRFLAGLGGSAPLSTGGGVIGDTWHAEERGKAIAIYSLAPLLGPVIGPVCGGWIAERSTWRWVFWSTTIVDAVIQLSGIFFLQETYAPYLLEKKAKAIRKRLDLENRSTHRIVRTVYETKEVRSWQNIFGKALTRPFVLFGTEPIIQLLGAYMALVYGIFYLFLTTMPSIFTQVYKETPGIGGLHYIALGIGLAGASQIMPRSWIGSTYTSRTKMAVGDTASMIPGTFLFPFGLFLTGWSATRAWHWIVTDIGIGFTGAGMILVLQSVQTYTVDTYTLHAASALAAVSCLRSLAGFGFPLFAPSMYAKLGFGKGDSILACVSILLGCPAPILLWKYGKQIRMASKYTSKPVPRTPHAAEK